MKKYFSKILHSNDGFGLNEIIGIAAAVVIAAFVIIPGLRTFATSIMMALSAWWGNVQGTVFPTS